MRPWSLLFVVLTSLLGRPAAAAWDTWALPSTWIATDGVLAATPGEVPLHGWQRAWPMGSDALAVFRVVPPAEGRSASFGLSAGEPTEAPRRTVQLAVRADGAVVWYDGQAWREAAPPSAGAGALTVALWPEPWRGQLRLMVGRGEGDEALHGPIPFWHQTGPPDTLYVMAEPGDPATPFELAAAEVFDPPAAPRAWLERVGPRQVRVNWIPVGAESYRIWRNGELIAERPAGSSFHLDTGLQPRTLYNYVVETSTGARSILRGIVTGPENELTTTLSGEFDVVVYGATPGGIAAAVTLGRRGRRVALVEPGDALGGMITGGLSRTDFGSIHALGGLFEDFIDDVAAYYLETYGPEHPNVTQWMRDGLYFEPKVARAIFLRWLAELPSVTIFRQSHLVGMKTAGRRATAAVIEDRRAVVRRVLSAPLFIDASYEGDLAAFAGAPFLIGREPAAMFDETYAGELWWDVWERKIVELVGTGDRKVQAYNYRVTLTRAVDNKLPPPPPRVYDRDRYVSLLPDIRAGKLTRLKDIIDILPLPERKADANNHPQGNPSSDFIGASDLYPVIEHELREVAQANHKDHILGLLWFVRFDPEVPESLRWDAQDWGLPRDEFPETDSWPFQLYVREGRRILAEQVFTEHDAMAAEGAVRPPRKPDAIAVGAYPIDSHATTPGRHPEHPDWLEGFFYLARGETQPYSIPYAIMLPLEIDGVIVSGCVSSTHVGYGTLRMEPVFMALGTAAGVAADLALDAGVSPRAVSVARLQRELLAMDQVLTVFEDLDHDSPGWAGFNLLGALGVFESYEARPDEPLTRAELRRWLAALPWPGWQAPVDGDDEPLTPAELGALLGELARAQRLAPPAPLVGAGPVTRGQGMAALWELIDAWLARQPAAGPANGT